MTVKNILNLLYSRDSGGMFMIQVDNTPVLGASIGQFVSLYFNDPRVDSILDIDVLSLSAYDNKVVIHI